MASTVISLDRGRVRIDLRTRQLSVDAQARPLGGRAFDLLQVLVERDDRVVGKHELLDLVWPGLVVEENNLQVQVMALRKALGNQAIATVPGRGYRLALVRDSVQGTPAPEPMPQPPAASRRAPPLVGVLHGRTVDLATLSTWLATCRCISVVGPPGVGKTTLAAALTAGSDAAWVDLTAVNDGAMIPGAVGLALGASVSGPSAVRALVRALAAAPCTLVLDNAEHLEAALGAFVQQLLAGAPQARLLITSRAPLKVPDEQVYRLQPLPVPLDSADAQALQGFASVAMFVDQVRALDRHFVLDERVAARVARICRKLDGLPLALRLAAARVPLLGLAGLEQRLAQPLRLLHPAAAGGSHPGGLSAALDASHALLSGAQQRVFMRLAVLGETFDLDLAIAVTGDAGLDDWAVLDALDVLVERSLVEVEPGPTPRYRLLESVRAHARAQLEASGERAALCARAAALCHARFPALAAREPQRLAALLDDAGLHQAAGAEWQRAAGLAQAAMRLVEAEFFLRRAIVAWQQTPADTQALQLAALLQLGSLAGITHGMGSPACEAVYRDVQPLADAVGTPEQRFIAAFNLWFATRAQLRVDESEVWSGRALALALASGDQRLLLQADHAQYTAAIVEGNFRLAAESALAGHRRYRLVDSAYHCQHFAAHDPGLCAAGHAACALWVAGRPAESDACLNDMRQLLGQVTHVPSLIIARTLEAHLLLLKGELPALHALAADTAALCRRLEVSVWEGCFTVLEAWAAVRQRPDPALCDRMHAALDRVLATGTRWRMPTYRVLLADALRHCGGAAQATAQIDLALQEMQAQREGVSRVMALEVHGALHSDAGRNQAAWATLQAATTLAAQQSAPGLGLGAAIALAAHAQRLGRGADAVAPLVAQLRPFDGADCPVLQTARGLLQRLQAA